MPAGVQEILGEAAKDHLLSDEQIVRAVLAGERALFEVLIRRHNRKVHRAVRSILKNDEEVGSVMQQAYVSAYFKLDQFMGASRFSPWLIRFAIHEAFAHVRRSQLFVETDAQDLAERLPSKDRNPEELASGRELDRVVAAVFSAIQRIETGKVTLEQEARIL